MATATPQFTADQMVKSHKQSQHDPGACEEGLSLPVLCPFIPGIPGLPPPHRTWGDFSDRKFWNMNQAGIALPSLNSSFWDRQAWTPHQVLALLLPAVGSAAYSRMASPRGLRSDVSSRLCHKHPDYSQKPRLQELLHRSLESSVTEVTLQSLSTYSCLISQSIRKSGR